MMYLLHCKWVCESVIPRTGCQAITVSSANQGHVSLAFFMHGLMQLEYQVMTEEHFIIQQQ